MRQPIILASGSPRRKELLEKMGATFTVVKADVDEHTDERPDVAVALLAGRKASAAARGLAEGLVLGADTLVALEGASLGKPQDAAEAAKMLHALSGKMHEVYTGVCLLDARTGKTMVHTEETRVTFRELTDEEISAYILSGEPMDKAGAYAIQGGAGAFVTSIEGSFSNVMGLPIEALTQMLADWEAD